MSKDGTFDREYDAEPSNFGATRLSDKHKQTVRDYRNKIPNIKKSKLTVRKISNKIMDITD